MKKIIFMLITLFMVSGCSVKYNIEIDEEKNVTDSMNIEFPSAISATYFDTTREYVDYMYETKTEELNISGYSKDVEIGDDFSVVTLSKSYSSVDSYLNNGIIKKLYSNVSVKEDNGKTVVSLTSMNDLFGTVNSYDANSLVDEIEITLNSKYVIEDDNADTRDITIGKYTWKINSDTFGKTIEFTITDKVNTSAVIASKFSGVILPIVILAILGIGYIIYAVFKKKFADANSI